MVQATKITGGHARFPNRWIDAGYMKAAPGNVTQVYLFMCRWAHNRTLIAKQSIRQMAEMLGTTENRIREATQLLQAWGVVERIPAAHNAVPQWRLLELKTRSPKLPTPNDVKGLKQLHDPTKMGRSNGDRIGDVSGTARSAFVYPTKTDPIETVPTETGRTYQTDLNQTEVNQTETIISCSSVETPEHDANHVGASMASPTPERATYLDSYFGGVSDEACSELSQSERRQLVRELGDELNERGHGFLLEDEQARRICAGEPMEDVLMDCQLGVFWTTGLEEIPFGAAREG